MIWHNAHKPSRGTRWFIVAVLLFTLVMLYGATRISPVGASAPQGVMFVECGSDGCQIDLLVPGHDEPFEFFVKAVVFQEVRS
jgi:hypothetical protein